MSAVGFSKANIGCRGKREMKCQLSNHRESIYQSIIEAGLIHYETIGKSFIKAARIGLGRSEAGNKTSNFPANQIVTNP